MIPFRLQDLAPVDARLCLAVERFVRQEAGSSLAASLLLPAVSGGADSIALLHILYLLRQRLGVELHVISLDHALRPEGAAECSAVAARCQELGLPCLVRRLEVGAYAAEHKMGLEQAGRTLRYAALEQERLRLGADWIVTGHQLEDLGEDVLLRLLRGTGWPGLGGMRALDVQRHLLRPLLLSSGQALRSFLTRCKLAWHEDVSNLDQRFKRNRVRHSIWPLLLEENPRLGEHMARLWQLARADEDYWNNELAPLLPSLLPSLSPSPAEVAAGSGAAASLCFEPAVLRGLGKAARLRLYLRAVQSLALGQGGQARAQSLFALDEAWRTGRGNTLFQFPGGIVGRVQGGRVCFFVPGRQK